MEIVFAGAIAVAVIAVVVQKVQQSHKKRSRK